MNVRLMTCALGFALIGSTAGAYTAEFTPAEAACAAQAASPFETGLETIGVALEKMVPEAAIETCWAALGTGQNDYRINAWMARAYYATGAFEEAFYYAHRAATESVPLGQYIAGILYSDGKGTQADPETGAKLLIAAAQAGFVPAFQGLAINLINGTGVAADPGLAVEFLQFAADEGFGPAATTLGKLYFDGVGVAKNDSEAARLMSLAVHLGDPGGMHQLAHYFEEGIGGPVDMPQAIRLYRAAIDHGNRDALVDLAVIFIEGIGVPEDSEQAYDLLRRAAELGDEDAAAALQWMEMLPEQQ